MENSIADILIPMILMGIGSLITLLFLKYKEDNQTLTKSEYTKIDLIHELIDELDELHASLSMTKKEQEKMILEAKIMMREGILEKLIHTE